MWKKMQFIAMLKYISNNTIFQKKKVCLEINKFGEIEFFINGSFIHTYNLFLSGLPSIPSPWNFTLLHSLPNSVLCFLIL